ncbi:MAG: hypothetical protein KDA83_12540, partial [Planctomycetales bacterium]|nr:hypothetical protein [Planctomycetales bacterium]
MISQLCCPSGGALDADAALNYNSYYASENRLAHGFSERHQRTITEVATGEVTLQTGTGIKYPFRALDTGTGYYSPPFGSTSKLQKTGSGWQETTEEFWVYDYDTTGRVINMSAPGGATWTVSYAGSSQRITSIESPVGRRTSYSYDGSSNLSKITDAGGRETLISIDGNGDLV